MGNVYVQVHYFVSSLIAGTFFDDHDTTGPLADPVLERIRIERNQSHKKVQDLTEQRKVIEMKSNLLDRLEAERIMELDRKEDLSDELSRAYGRKDRELTWVELLKRIAWKLYASTRRMAGYLISWWNNDEDEIVDKLEQEATVEVTKEGAKPAVSLAEVAPKAIEAPHEATTKVGLPLVPTASKEVPLPAAIPVPAAK